MSPLWQRSTATIAPPGAAVGLDAVVDTPLPITIHWSCPVSLKQEMMPKVLVSCFASAAVKNVVPQSITPAVLGAGPAAAAACDLSGGRVGAACWTARHLAADICPVHEYAGGPPNALERPARTSPVKAAAAAMTGITANILAGRGEGP